MDELYERLVDSLDYLVGGREYWLGKSSRIEILLEEGCARVDSLDYLLPGVGGSAKLVRDCATIVHKMVIELRKAPEGDDLVFLGATVKDSVRNAVVSVFNSAVSKITRAAFDSLVEACSDSFVYWALRPDICRSHLWPLFCKMVEGREEMHLRLWEATLMRFIWAVFVEQIPRTAATHGTDPTKLSRATAAGDQISTALSRESDVLELARMVDELTGVPAANPMTIPSSPT
jgi:hypothetical protein